MGRRPPRKRLTADPPELNLVPLLDMVALLIQLMLINAQFGTFAELPTTAATTSKGNPDASPLALAVRLTTTGYSVAWTEGGQRRGQDLPCPAGACGDATTWDTAGLQQLVGELKDRFPADREVMLQPGPGIPFEVMVRTMDELREGGDPPRTLFPDVLFPGGRR